MMRLSCCLLLLTFAVTGLCQSPTTVVVPTHEETVVRDTYGRISFAGQIGILAHAAILHSDGWPKLDDEPALRRAMANQIRFSVGSFQVGDLTQISQTKWTSLATTFPNAALQIAYQDLPFSMQTRKGKTLKKIIYADVAWSNETGTRGGDQTDPTVQDALKSVKSPKGGTWSRYASFTVNAALQGRSVSYQALFLFGKDNNGNETILPIDYFAGSGIAPFVANPMYPAALLETAVREVPLIEQWIAANRISGCKKGADYPEVCCDSSRGRCGIASEDVEKSLKIPVDPDTRWFIRREKEEK